MPIYEFYCPDCHTVFSFFAQSTSVRKRPDCPKCGHPKLEKRPSTFAFVKGGEGDADEDDDLFGGIDETRLEGAMESMAGDLERMGDTEDPRAMGQIFRRFSELTGLELGDRMQEAMQRMEQGEDLEEIESELEGDDDDLEDLFKIKKKILGRSRRPKVDETLHFL